MNNKKKLCQDVRSTQLSWSTNENASGENEAGNPKYCTTTIAEKLDPRNELKNAVYGSIAHEDQVSVGLPDSQVIKTDRGKEEQAGEDIHLIDEVEPELQHEQDLPTPIATGCQCLFRSAP